MAKRKRIETAEEAETKKTLEETTSAGAPEAAVEPQPEQAVAETQLEVDTEVKETAVVATEAGEAEVGLEKQLELALEEAAKNLEGWQRAAAELANYKRRQEEQLKLQRDRIKGEVLAGVISALDDMDLAFQNVPEELNGQLVGWVEGFRLVQRKLNKVLEEQNVMPISTEGDFDPTVHEAVSYEESNDHKEGQIIGELRKGYQVGNRVLRPALVRVAK
jgi:molecular chaperone GrpE